MYLYHNIHNKEYMTEITETIKVSKPVKEALEKLKAEGHHTSFDSVLRELLPQTRIRRRNK
jgi:predicted CopG family antitoxin